MVDDRDSVCYAPEGVYRNIGFGRPEFLESITEIRVYASIILQALPPEIEEQARYVFTRVTCETIEARGIPVVNASKFGKDFVIRLTDKDSAD